MERYKILIADDERHARDRLRQLLSAHREFEVTCEASGGDQALALLAAQPVDVAFLDIHMPGVSVFRSITSLKHPPLIVFQTAYAEHAVTAFDVEAVDYLLKPFSRERLAQCMDRLIIKLTRTVESLPETDLPELNSFPPRQISVKAGHVIKVLSINEIIKINFEEGFSFVYTAAGRFLTDKYLNYFENLLEAGSFYRINRTQIVNLGYIKMIHPMFNGSYRVELANGEKLDVSRRRAGELKRLLAFI